MKKRFFQLYIKTFISSNKTFTLEKKVEKKMRINLEDFQIMNVCGYKVRYTQ